MANISNDGEEMETFSCTPAGDPAPPQRTQEVSVGRFYQVRRRKWLFFVVFGILAFLILLVIGILQHVQTDKNLKRTENLQKQLGNCWDHLGNSQQEIQNSLKQIENILKQQNNFLGQLRTSVQQVKSSQGQMNDSLYFEFNKIQQNVTEIIELLNQIRMIGMRMPPVWPMPNPARCLANWVMFAGSCYFFSMDQQNWTFANNFCMSVRAQLVVIDSDNEQNFLVSRIQQNIFWIGLSDRGTEGDWRWVDGTDYASTRKYWAADEPNDFEGSEDCGTIRGGGVWNDQSCERDFRWICEQNNSPTAMSPD